MLCSLFLPILILIIIGWCAMLFFESEGFWTYRSTMLGVPVQVIFIAFSGLPFLLWLWMLWSGNWRRPVLLAAIVCFSVTIIAGFELIEEYSPPETRMIHLSGTAGADVYCNGVLLGQLPLKIRVDELKDKVPEWTTPPEQRWYSDTDLEQRLVTWVPWDDFRKERFEATQALGAVARQRNAVTTPRAMQAQRDALNQHDAGARYWWSYQFGDTQMAFLRSSSYYLYRTYEKQTSYYNNLSSAFSPSVGFHAQLLIDVLPELTPEQKTDWDRHVLKNWALLSGPLQGALSQAARHHHRNKNEALVELYENALHSTARLHYGLSDPPTEDECRKLLADWIKTSMLEGYRSGFYFGYSSYYGGYTLPGPPTVAGDVLIPPDINETMHKPVMEQWKRNKYRFENGWAPVVYFAWKGKAPDYFADLTRWSATTGKARSVVLENKAPDAVALFNTMLHRRDLMQTFERNINLYAGQIRLCSSIDNPLVEEGFREFILRALSDSNHTDYSRQQVEGAVVNAIYQRMDWESIDKDDLAGWVASLPIPVQSKNLALRTLRIRSDKDLTFADKLQQVAGRVSIETELTLEDLVEWFAENPEGNLYQFLEEQDENILVANVSDSRGTYDLGSFSSFSPSRFYEDGMYYVDPRNYQQWDGLPNLFVVTLFRMDTPEGEPQIRELIKRIWADAKTSNLVERAIHAEYGMGVNPRRGEQVADLGSLHLPDYILDFLLTNESTLTEEGASGSQVQVGGSQVQVVSFDRTGLASILALCESSKAGEILEKWLDEAPTKQRVERCLEVWRTREAIRQMKMEMFQDIVAGRMSPDDLLLPQPPWVWKDGQYVQAE